MISILLPLKNGIEFLRDSINTVLAQTYQQYELLIGCNGINSFEYKNIRRIVQSFNNSKIKVFFFNTHTKTETLNELVYQAKYPNIALIDVDDLWVPNKLKLQIPLLEKYDVIGSNFEYFGDANGDPQLYLGKLCSTMFTTQNPLANSSAILKKKYAHWQPYWELLNDFHLWLFLLDQGKLFYNCPEILTKIRIHKNSFFNHKNAEASDILITQRKEKHLTPEEHKRLIDIFDNKKWELA